MKCRGSTGFTLLEVLVSATIIAVLTAIGIVSYSSVNKRSRDVKRKSDLEQIRAALEMYRSDNSEYPNTGASFVSAQDLTATLVSTYTPAIPTDPSSSGDYQYIPVATSGIYSGYCVCGMLETIANGASETTCTVSLPATCNYGLKSP